MDYYNVCRLLLEVGKHYGEGVISEKILQKLILEDILAFLDELGRGFTFIYLI